MRYKQLLEKRKNPDLNIKSLKIDDDIAKCYKQDSNQFVSFTSIPKLGLNPNNEYRTPYGVYSYPIEYVKNTTVEELPFANTRPYVWVFKVHGIGLDIGNYHSDTYRSDMRKLRSFAFDNDITHPHFIVPKKSSDRVRELFNTIRKIASEISSDIPLKTTTIMKDILKYSYCVDPGFGIIHENEPSQCIVYETSAIYDYKMFKNTHKSEYPETDDYGHYDKPSTIEPKISIPVKFSDKTVLVTKQPKRVDSDIVIYTNCDIQFGKQTILLQRLSNKAICFLYYDLSYDNLENTYYIAGINEQYRFDGSLATLLEVLNQKTQISISHDDTISVYPGTEFKYTNFSEELSVINRVVYGFGDVRVIANTPRHSLNLEYNNNQFTGKIFANAIINQIGREFEKNYPKNVLINMPITDIINLLIRIDPLVTTSTKTKINFLGTTLPDNGSIMLNQCKIYYIDPYVVVEFKGYKIKISRYGRYSTVQNREFTSITGYADRDFDNINSLITFIKNVVNKYELINYDDSEY